MAYQHRHTPERNVAKLSNAEVEAAKRKAIAEACKDLAITDDTRIRRGGDTAA